MTGANMKIAIALLFSVAVLVPSSGKEKPPAGDAVAASIGLEIGQRVPEFALTDQLGHEQSNETLKGSKGTIILFFRSADW
jgi:cytochrome oxidase Cu insertion factor (SCO1/SenC/PrrC family)